jgi:hypothetical protein
MDNRSNNINKLKNYTSYQILNMKNDIWQWKSSSWLEKGTYMLWIKLVNWIPILLSWFVCLMVFNGTFSNTSVIFVAVRFIGGGNWRTRRKPQTCHKSLPNFIT